MHVLNFHKGCALHNERMGLKLHQLRYLVAIAESGSIRAAASKMAVWPSWPQACILPGCWLA